MTLVIDNKANPPGSGDHANREIHRALSLTSPLLEGPDVKKLQEEGNDFFKSNELPRRIEEDGELGGHTIEAVERMIYLLGIFPAGQNGAGPIYDQAEQRIVRTQGEGRSAKEKDRGKRRIEEARRAIKDGKKGADLAVEWMLEQVNETEHPLGSNWSNDPAHPLVRDVISFCGMGPGTYWCGCFQAYAAIKIGGAAVKFPTVLTHNVQMLTYARTGGYGVSMVSLVDAQKADIVSYTFAHIGGLLAPISGGRLQTVEGNTGQEGQQNNGGGVYRHDDRSTGLVLGIVRPNYGNEKKVD